MKKEARIFSVNDILNSPVGHLNKHLVKEPEKKKHKYSSQKVDLDGKPFDSKKEAKRYTELKLLLKAGEIAFLARQVEYELNTEGSFSLVYVADFVYTDVRTGQSVVEDAKGFRTTEYKKKCKLMKKVHGITIKEI